MQQTWNKALKDSISDVFSTMFFMVPAEDPQMAESLVDESAAEWIEGWVDLTGPEGQLSRVWVWSPETMARELAANILSCEPEELNQDDVLDAYREMLNMVAGSHLTAVDAKSSWRMGLPQAQRPTQAGVREMTGQAEHVIFFDVDEVPLAAGWRDS